MNDLDQELKLLEEKKRRRQLRSSLHSWSRHATGFEPAAHHDFLNDRLEDVTFGRLGNLIFLMPPGAAKSKYISNGFPPWWMSKNKQGTILATSYSHTLIESFGGNCRNLVEHNQNELGITLKSDRKAAGEWETNEGGRYFCAGVGAGLAGHRADLAFIDDYLGNQEDADSKTVREKQWQWYLNDFCPRLKPGCPIIIVANRRHEDDLVGRILNEEPELWTLVRLPMEAEEEDPLGRNIGDTLWPEWFLRNPKAIAQVARAKKNPRTWAGLYQQRPAPEEGLFFNKDWIVEYRPSDLPRDLRFYCASDHAVRTKESNDRTCLLAAGLDSNGRLWILPDWFWDRADTGVVVERMLDMASRRKPLRWWAGSDHITGSIGPFLNKRMLERNIFFPLDEVTARGDKSARAQSIAGRMSAKMVMFPSYAPGWDKAKHEILTFPGGTHDDFVDALAELGRGLDQMVNAHLTVTATGNTLPQQRLTVKWIKDSAKRRERREALNA